MLKTISLTALSLLIVGCGSVNKTTIQKKITTQKVAIKKDKTPSWVYEPSKPNQICEVGSAINDNNAKEKAFLKAKSNIGKQIKVYINSQNEKSIKCTTQDCKTSFKIFSNHQSSQMLNDITITDRYIDNNSNRYYLRACTIQNDDIFEYKKKTINNAKSPLQTTKKSCIIQSSYPNKNLSELKKLLVQQVKQNSVEELYGTLMYSNTDFKNGKLSKDQIKNTAVGSVRIKGDPTFYNGDNLGEICANITSYITKKDIERYSPKKVKLNHFCYVNQTMSLKKIKDEAKYKAYIESITKYKPSLKNISKSKATQLIHGFITSNEKFDFSSGAYCFDSVATLLPYELDIKSISTLTDNIQDIDQSKFIPGLIATFYNRSDYKMSKPIYQDYVDSLLLGYKKLPINQTIHKNIPYRVKITGYLKSEKQKTIPLKLYADVYEAKLYINDKLILTNKKIDGKVKLKKGFNKIKLILTTANRYDTKITGDLLDLYTNKIK